MTNTAGYSDIDLQFRKQRDGDIKLLVDVEAINANILNIASTMQGSRRMLPNFAYNAYNFLFEQMSEETSKRLGDAILDAIEQYEDRIDVTNIHIDRNISNLTYEIMVTYTLKSEGSKNAHLLSFILKKL